jgi:transposase InsO family protein
MKIFNKFRKTKGFISTWERVIRFRDMITKEAQRRMRILIFWQEHGLKATKDAFGVSRRTLFDWKQRLDKGEGKLDSLNPKSKAPIKRRKRSWDERLLEEIKNLRIKHPNLGAEKLYPLLLDFADTQGIAKCPRSSTIERLIKDLGGLRTKPQKITGTGRIVKANRNKILRKPKAFKALYPGHCLALDTIERQRGGRRMYVLTIIDLFTRTAFAIGTKSHSSKTFAHFFYLVMGLFPYEIKNVLTDNGSEFKKHLNQLLQNKGINHYHTYPRTPKMNAHSESFNGTVQDEFTDYHINLLFDDITQFNEKLNEYLLFFNTKRVHYAFKNKFTPLEILSSNSYYLSQLPEKCRNGWGYAKPCKLQLYVLYW